MDINQLSQVIEAVSAMLSIIVLVGGSMKSKMETFSLSKKSRVQKHLLSYGEIYAHFDELRRGVRDIMRSITLNNVLKAYSLWSFSKTGLLYLLWISLVGIYKKELDFYYGVLMVAMYFFWLVFLFWSFVFSQFNALKNSIPKNLTYDALQMVGGSTYLVYVFSAFGFVGVFVAYYLDKLLDIQWDWKLILMISLGVSIISFMLFWKHLSVNSWKDRFKLLFMLIVMMFSLIAQFDIGLSKISDNVKIWIFIVYTLEFLLIGLITSRIGSNLTSLLWKLKIRDKEIMMPWIQISTKEGGIVKGFLFDLLDDDYLILKDGYCYHTISWNDLNPNEITVCGDTLYEDTFSS